MVKAEDVKFLPIYTGMPGEEKQSINVGTENFFAINKQASPEKQKLAADFIYWLYSSPKGKAFVTNDLKFIAPFDTFADNEKPTDPLAKEVIRYMSNTRFIQCGLEFHRVPEPDLQERFWRCFAAVCARHHEVGGCKTIVDQTSGRLKKLKVNKSINLVSTSPRPDHGAG